MGDRGNKYKSNSNLYLVLIQYSTVLDPDHTSQTPGHSLAQGIEGFFLPTIDVGWTGSSGANEGEGKYVHGGKCGVHPTNSGWQPRSLECESLWTRAQPIWATGSPVREVWSRCLCRLFHCSSFQSAIFLAPKSYDSCVDNSPLNWPINGGFSY